MNKRIGFIGCGKMAQAMIQGILNSQLLPAENIYASSASEETITLVREKFGIFTCLDNRQIARAADVLILAVKPDVHKSVIKQIKDSVSEHTIIITIAAGITLQYIEESFGEHVKAIRTMPNTPSLVGEGMTAIAANRNVLDEELRDMLSIFASFGRIELIEEKLMNAIPAISGSSPAYVYMLIEALADGGVMQGIPRKQAYQFAAQAVMGAAKMVLETGMHPGVLKDDVCTPGGATIQAIATLEKERFRSAVISAMESCTKRTEELAQK
ncbi:pyrroline-5-carboxylate reductase [Bacillus canaveralius]|uniref:Pyrroline-5-carboxylate reductase n=1 Tax=Bacillus canaveralius TaxID=1403243 RepID=A0A2N5GFW8_9BACI|nr:pyrroline-5-carboxylate reductase [Bacillus canaveralius]PLR79659.1 pyrroline-5-carboxylate reductase [Bacillus canaveralius]PLS00851.1 pyrroline-5-carboxylate reductase [Bacillus canaveralius]RSK53800.1 pyrroline-5-carboxylate reductase [Bacillus canaveralius]